MKLILNKNGLLAFIFFLSSPLQEIKIPRDIFFSGKTGENEELFVFHGPCFLFSLVYGLFWFEEQDIP